MYCWDTNSILPLYSIMLQPLPISLTKATAVPFASCIMAVPLVLGVLRDMDRQERLERIS